MDEIDWWRVRGRVEDGKEKFCSAAVASERVQEGAATPPEVVLSRAAGTYVVWLVGGRLSDRLQHAKKASAEIFLHNREQQRRPSRTRVV